MALKDSKMTTYSYSSERCLHIVKGLYNMFEPPSINQSLTFTINITLHDVHQLENFCYAQKDIEDGNKYNEPMVWIGIYIAIASLVCILAMAADLLYGFRNRKFWFPSKYFSLNAASITVITVAMKLPVDLSSDMPSSMNQAAKLGSIAFMCTMMANLMPSLASMDSDTLLANVIGLSILVITIVVNIYIQINTSVIKHIHLNLTSHYSSYDCVVVAYIFMFMILLLIIIIISSSLTIPASKEILEAMYQATNKTSLTDNHLQHTQMPEVEKLRQHVRKYWVMAETGSPQFVMATNPLSTASGVICVIVLILNLLMVLKVLLRDQGEHNTYGSPYKRSVLAIVITQSIGVVVGTIAPLFRCFSVLSFKFITSWNRNRFTVFKVEIYWTKKLYEWKEIHIPFLKRSRRSKTLIHNSKNIILSLCIGFQKVIVVSCKVIWLIPMVVLRFAVYFVYFWKSLETMMFRTLIASKTDDTNNDLSRYVLHIHEEMELAEKTLEGILISMNSFILKAEKKQNNDLLGLLKKSTGFSGVENFDTDHIQPLLAVQLVNTWSLPIVTLTSIAVSLPNIRKVTVQRLLKSVDEGLSYTHLVEEILNSASEHTNIRKATMTLWHDVKYSCKWLNCTLSKYAFEGKTATEILNWFADKAEGIVTEIEKSSDGKMVENSSPKELIASNSMYRIARTILHRDESNTEPLSKKQLFSLLRGMIADILSACFTNIPQVITMKCHECVIEKREASVKVAAKLLGNTTKIIERLESCKLPNMDHDKMAYIDEWHLYLKQSTP